MENIHQGHREKMRQRFLKSGLEGFADHEALELLLYYAIPRQDTNPIAHRLMDRYGSLTAVLSAPAEDLKKVEGIGESAAVLLKVAGQIGRKARLADAVQSCPMTDVETVGAYLLERYAGETHEIVYELCLDRKGKLLACKRLNDGGASSAALDIRKVVENAILTSASTDDNTPSMMQGGNACLFCIVSIALRISPFAHSILTAIGVFMIIPPLLPVSLFVLQAACQVSCQYSARVLRLSPLLIPSSQPLLFRLVLSCR